MPRTNKEFIMGIIDWAARRAADRAVKNAGILAGAAVRGVTKAAEAATTDTNTSATETETDTE